MNKPLLVIALAGISAVVFANDPPQKPELVPPPHSTFAQLDKNSDGLVSLTEATNGSWTREQFDSIDRDDDGAVDPNEFAALVK